MLRLHAGRLVFVITGFITYKTEYSSDSIAKL